MREMQLIDAGPIRDAVDRIEMPEAVYARLVALIDGAPRITVKAVGEKKAPTTKLDTAERQPEADGERLCPGASCADGRPRSRLGAGTGIANDKGAASVYEQVAALYREMCPELPGVRDMTDARRRAMHARCEAAPEGQIWAMWRELFGHVRRSSFLRGNNSRGWRASLDWLINATNFDKVMAGTYDDRGTEGNAAGSFDTEEFFQAACARR